MVCLFPVIFHIENCCSPNISFERIRLYGSKSFSDMRELFIKISLFSDIISPQGDYTQKMFNCQCKNKLPNLGKTSIKAIVTFKGFFEMIIQMLNSTKNMTDCTRIFLEVMVLYKHKIPKRIKFVSLTTRK